jgi:glucosamine--fructose-6-phosphate aminotransferase (isomerizing)
LEDHQLAVLRPQSWQILNRDGTTVTARVHSLVEPKQTLDKGNFAHHMLKEIYEQPEAIANALHGCLDDVRGSARLEGFNLAPERWQDARRLLLIGCGTSYHAALVGEYLIETLARIPVEVEYASEFRYRQAPLDGSPVIIALSQSGETADTLAAVRECRRQGHLTLAICNGVHSTLAREVEGVVSLRAGPEIGVASTKAFAAQLVMLTLLALFLGRLRHLSRLQGDQMIQELRASPDWVRQTLACQAVVQRIAAKYADAGSMLYLGRHYLYPIALEGALKLQEVSYVHARGYPAAEMKHGPIALVDERTPVLVLALRGPLFDKVMNNLEEVKARGAPVIAVACAGDEDLVARADDVIYVPDVPDYLQPLIAVVPLQLLAYSMAVLRGCDVDKPRNLAKSVTVE